MKPITGWDNGLCQDYCYGLGAWFANRLGAREELRRTFVDRGVELERRAA